MHVKCLQRHYHIVSAIEGLTIVLLLQYLLLFSGAKQGLFALAVSH